MSESPILSICIPTYNQPKSVEAFFNCISSQLTKEIEILIRDDSPNSDTELVVRRYAPELPVPIHYYRGEKPKVGGYDEALLFLTAKAKGKFLWWYGDDVLAPDAVQRILALVSAKPNLSFVWLNSHDINNPSDQALSLEGDKYFRNGSEVFSTNVGLLGFPSATLLRREEALTGFEAAKKFIGTTLTGFYLVLHVISQKDKDLVFLQDPCLFSNPKPLGEVRWYDSFQVHAINYFVIAHEFKHKFEHKAFRKGLSDQYGRIWRAVIVERAQGFETGFASRKINLAKMTRLYWSYPELYIAILLMLTPRPVLRLFYTLYKKLKSSSVGPFVSH